MSVLWQLNKALIMRDEVHGLVKEMRAEKTAGLGEYVAECLKSDGATVTD